jgi:hypothetical protein
MSTSGSFTPADVPECPYAPRMTRAAALALRTAAGLKENCVVVITDGPVIGTAGNTSATEIELNPVSPTELGTTARVHTTFATSAWPGVYDIDLGTAGSITELTDDWGNTAKDIDADSPTVHGQFPWHLGSTTMRDNYVEDAVLTGWDTQVGALTNNRVVGSTVNLTGKANGSIADCEFTGTTVTSGATPFFIGTQSRVRGGTLDFGAGTAVGNIILTRADLQGVTVTRDPAASGSLTISGSRVSDSTFTQGAGATGTLSVTDSDVSTGTLLNVDPGSAKGITLNGAIMRGYSVRTQDSGGSGVTLTSGTFFGKPNLGDSLLVHGVGGAGLSIGVSNVDGFSVAGAGQGSIDMNGAASSALISSCDIHNSRINVGPGAGAFQSTGAEYAFATINANASTGGRLTINGTAVRGGTVNHAAASTQNLQLSFGRVEGSGLVELLSGDRALSLTNTDVINGIVRQTTVNAASVPNSNSVNDCRVLDLGRIIFSETTPAGQVGSSVSRSTVKGSSLGAGVDGVFTITGVSAFVQADSLDVRGVVILTDVPSGALSGGTSFHDISVGPVSSLTYTAGDATAKQIRNVDVSGQSTVTLTSLTGSAGVGVGDFFGVYVRGQSLVTMTGARVSGQPVRDVTVEQGGTLNVAASGSVQRFRVAGGATVNTGAFNHFDTEISLATTKTLTASNVNRLCSKAFDDTI